LLVALVPVPVTVPGSPDPLSPAVLCQGAEPSSNDALAGDAESWTVAPVATHTFCVAAVDVVPLFTDTVHQLT
jgi:hypothetical protein